MADYSNAAGGPGADGFVEEYQHGQLRVRRGSLKDQLAATAMAEGLAARRANGGLLHVAKPQEPSDE